MADIQGTRALQGRIQQLNSDAGLLFGNRNVRPRATLAAQKEKIQEMEKVAMLRVGGTVVPVPGDAAHKRATEQAREAVVSRGLVEVSPADHPRKLNPDADLDHELYHRHAERLANWLERAKHSTVSRGQQLHGRHLVRNARSYNASLVESAGVVRPPALDNYTHPAPSYGQTHTAVTQAHAALPLDARAPQYSRIVKTLNDDDVKTSVLQIKQLSQLSSSGAGGPRAAHLRRTAEGLWDAVESLVQATTSPCEAALPRELARVSACRELLEADFATYLRREYGHSQSVGTRQLAEQHARIHFVSAGGDMDRWAVAYLCLRAGDVQAFCETARAQLGDNTLACQAETFWPPVQPSASGALTPAPTAMEPLADITESNVRANPFKHAVQLILSRTARVSQVDVVKEALGASSALKFAQDHVWLHLALINRVDVDDRAPRADTLFSLEVFAGSVEQVPPAELCLPLDPLLYCKVMLWGQCFGKAVAALLPPTGIPELADFALEGLHLGLLLSRFGMLDEASGTHAQLQAQLEGYVLRLLPHDAEAALHYLRLLPPASMQAAFHAVCQHRHACERLLGRVSTDGTADTSKSAAARFFPSATCAGLANGAAAMSRERDIVILSVESSLLALYYCVQHDTAQGVQTHKASAVIRELLSFLNVRLAHAINELDDAAALSQRSQDTLTVCTHQLFYIQE